ncbi:hypothetical protein ACFX13_013255 [Malus domestica]
MSSLITAKIKSKADELYHGHEICQQKSNELLSETCLPNGLLPLKDIEECGIDLVIGVRFRLFNELKLLVADVSFIPPPLPPPPGPPLLQSADQPPLPSQIRFSDACQPLHLLISVSVRSVLYQPPFNLSQPPLESIHRRLQENWTDFDAEEDLYLLTDVWSRRRVGEANLDRSDSPLCAPVEVESRVPATAQQTLCHVHRRLLVAAGYDSQRILVYRVTEWTQNSQPHIAAAFDLIRPDLMAQLSRFKQLRRVMKRRR